jgi:hypothetical protein
MSTSEATVAASAMARRMAAFFCVCGLSFISIEE